MVLHYDDGQTAIVQRLGLLNVDAVSLTHTAVPLSSIYCVILADADLVKIIIIIKGNSLFGIN